VISGTLSIDNRVFEENYCRFDDGSKPGSADLIKTYEKTWHTGSAGYCMSEDIHSVCNNGNKVAVLLYTYVRRLNHMG